MTESTPKLSYLINELNKNFYKICFFMIIITFVIFSTLYSLYAPSFEGPDEQFHYGFTKDVYSGTLSEIDYVKQGPLYFSISAFFLNFIEPPENIEIKTNSFFPRDANKFIHSFEEQFPYSGTAYAVHLLRLISIIGGVVTIIFTYKIAMLVFSQNRSLSLFTMAFVALIPKFVWINSVMNPDSFVYAFTTIAIFFLIKFVNNVSKTRFLILFSVFTGLALFTKANASILFVIVAVLFLYLLFSKQISTKSFFSKLTLIGIISVLSGSWFTFHRILLTINLDNLHYKSIFSLVTSTTESESKPVNFFDGLYHFTEIGMIHQRMFEMLWGWLGWHVIKTSNLYLMIGDAFVLLALTGLFLIFIKKVKWNHIKINSTHLVILFSGTGFMIFAMLTYFYNGGNGDIRYTFPAISLFGILFTLGISIFVNKKKLRYLLVLPIIILVFMNIHLLETMDDRYDHGFKSFNIDPFSSLLDIYDKRPDLQKYSKEAADGNLSKLIGWADTHGYKEHEVLKKHEALYDLLSLYYSRIDLQEQFPEVIRDHDIKNLIIWAMEKGIYEESKLSVHSKYFYGYYKYMT
jgi:hypothetical protein